MRFRVLANLPRAIAALGLLSVLNVLAFAQQQPQLRSVTYRLSMSLPMSHLFEVKIEVELPDGANQSLDFQMPRWSPGRYAVFDFAKNVQEVWAASGICPRNQGRELTPPFADKPRFPSRVSIIRRGELRQKGTQH